MAELHPRHIPPLGMLTAPIDIKTSPYLHSYLPKSTNFPLQEMIQQTLLTPSLAIARVEDLDHHLHSVHIIHLSNQSRLVIKAGPSPIAPLLRHERYLLDNEALCLQILARTDLPIPRLFKHDTTSTRLGSPFNLTTCLPGIPYLEASKHMTSSERAGIDHHLVFLNAAISQHLSSAPHPWGPVVLAASQQGYKTWKEAFRAMLESVLMDGEDLLINMPYLQIRAELARSEGVLDAVTEPRLVVLGVCEPRNVLIDRQTNTVTGLLDFGRALWADWQCGAMDQAVGPKKLLYAIYHAVSTIVTSHYRKQDGDQELDARKKLTAALAQLSTIMIR
ncbi:MAG: hypothetical protein Q9174_004064 [Haloplaca sp. 1 TL-2023]